MHELPDLDKLLAAYLGPNRSLISYECTNLTGPGENYGSIMLKLDFVTENKSTKLQETVHVVAKTPPPSELLQEVFNTPVTFKNEIAFYKDIFPEFRKIQQENGLKPVDYYPAFVASRLNLSEEDVVDENAVLVLDNLIFQGFDVVSRYEGFDLETTKMILGDLANFHATSIALRKNKPDVYDKKIKPYLDGMHPKENPQLKDSVSKASSEICLNSPKLKHLEAKLVAIVQAKDDFKPQEPFLSVIHNDLWVNNTMLKFENGKPSQNKFVDFQVCATSSPLVDLLFFLLTSIQNQVLKANFDSFLQLYYKELVKTLDALKCDTTAFTSEAFNQELHRVSKRELAHTAGMLFPILKDKSGAKELKDLAVDDDFFTNPSANHVRKLETILPLVEAKGWLD